jgi:hypothetical protein
LVFGSLPLKLGILIINEVLSKTISKFVGDSNTTLRLNSALVGNWQTADAGTAQVKVLYVKIQIPPKRLCCFHYKFISCY